MKNKLIASLLALSCLNAIIGTTSVEASPLKPGELGFTRAMVAGKTMSSSGYPNGTITFNTNGSMTCSNYPAFVTCKSWRIDLNGKLQREFTDAHTGAATEVIAHWKLLSNNGATLQVSQTSNNSTGETTLTVTYR